MGATITLLAMLASSLDTFGDCDIEIDGHPGEPFWMVMDDLPGGKIKLRFMSQDPRTLPGGGGIPKWELRDREMRKKANQQKELSSGQASV